MIKGTKNQMFNINNWAQGKTKKVLTVCSAGLLRSATLQNLLTKEYGYNVRNCGTEESYALIPISEALVMWADEIVFVNKMNYKVVESEIIRLGIKDKCYILDIPDVHEFNDPKLIDICREQYNNEIGVKEPIDIKSRVLTDIANMINLGDEYTDGEVVDMILKYIEKELKDESS